MDKFEYKVRADEIKNLISRGDFIQAAEIADTIDWRRVKSVIMLCTISDLYKINRRYEDAKNILLLAYDRRPGGRTICYSLCELCLKTEDLVEALKYYNEFVQASPKDPGRYILQYKIYEAQDVSLEERISVLEELKKRDYREKWAYELAYLYHRIGLATRCVEECDEMILWFGDGKYIIKAMELKMLHQPLSPQQQEKYDHRFDEYNQPAVQEESVKAESSDPTYEEQQYYDAEEASEEENDQADPLAGDTIIYEGIHHAVQEQIAETAEPVQTSEPAAEQEQPEELDFHVKTMDMGQYNTLNLQAELAAGLREVLGDDQSKSAAITRSIVAPMIDTESLDYPEIDDEDIDENDVDNGIEQIESTEVFFGETEEVDTYQLESAVYADAEGVGTEEFVPDLEAEAPVSEAGEEVSTDYYSETGEEVSTDYYSETEEEVSGISEEYTQDVEEDMPEEYVAEPETFVSESAGDFTFESDEEMPEIDDNDTFVTEEISEISYNDIAEPREELVETEAFVSDLEDEVEAADEEPQAGIDPEAETVFTTESVIATETVPEVEHKADAAADETADIVMNQLRKENMSHAAEQVMIAQPPKEIAGVLSQESDGQISLVMPENETVEKQITGQMSIEDILAEWERMKKEGEERRKEEVRQRVLQQTGNMFTEFEASMRDGLLEQLENDQAEDGQAAAVEEAAIEAESAVEPEPTIIFGSAVEPEEIEPEVQPEAEFEPEAEYEAEPEPAVMFGPAVEPEPAVMFGSAVEPEPAVIFGSAIRPEEFEPEVQPEAEFEPEAEYEVEPEPAVIFGSAVEPESTIIFGSAIQPEEFEPEVQPEAEIEPEAEYEAEPEPAVMFGPAVEPEPAVIFGSAVEPESTIIFGSAIQPEEFEPEVQPEAEVEPEAEYESKSEPVAILEVDPEVESEPEVVAAAESVPDFYTEEIFVPEPKATELEEESEVIFEIAPRAAERVEDPATVVQAEAELQSEVPTVPEAAAETRPEVHPEPEAEAESKSGVPTVPEAAAGTRPEVPAEPETTLDKTSAETNVESQVSVAETVNMNETSDAEAGENLSETTNVEAAMKAVDAMIREAEANAKGANDAWPPEVERDKAKIRALTREEKEHFAPYIQSKAAREQLAQVIDGISMASYTGNVIIIGDEGMDTTTLAKNIVREVQLTDSNFSGKVAKISGQSLNNKNIAATLRQLDNGALIIQKASGMNSTTAASLNKELQRESLGIVVVMEDTRKAMNRLLDTNKDLEQSFTAKMEVQALSNDMLVLFAKQYAKELEYSIDELGILALHTRIEAMQTLDHAVTVLEVKQIVDDAIRHASKKTLGHFMDILLAKRYDEEDMIVLNEKDFA